MGLAIALTGGAVTAGQSAYDAAKSAKETDNGCLKVLQAKFWDTHLFDRGYRSSDHLTPVSNWCLGYATLECTSFDILALLLCCSAALLLCCSLLSIPAHGHSALLDRHNKKRRPKAPSCCKAVLLSDRVDLGWDASALLQCLLDQAGVALLVRDEAGQGRGHRQRGLGTGVEFGFAA